MKMLKPKHTALLDEARRCGQHDIASLSLCFEILSLATAIDDDCAGRLSTHDLTEGRFVLLFLLHSASDALAPHELASRAGVTRATITGLLDGLERGGLISRHATPQDRRMLMIQLTPNGKKIAEELFAEHTRWITTLFSELSHDERQTLSGLLRRIWSKTDSSRSSP